MKKTILTAIAMCCAASVFAQGTVIFNNRNGNTTHVYSTTGTVRISGNAANDVPAGGAVYTGNTLIGTAGGLAAATTFASLLGAGGNLADDSTMAVGNLGTAFGGGTATTFRTGTASSGIASTTATFNNIAKDLNSGATFEMVAWDNSSGNYSTWALAKTAWTAGLIRAGKSDLFSFTAGIGGDVNTPPIWSDSLNVKSFNIYFAVPEPTTIALAGIASAAMLILRRRK